jgi:hypothetical protein
MSEELIRQYESLMKQQEYKKAGDLVLDNFDLLIDLAILDYDEIHKRDPYQKFIHKDKQNKYQIETPGELVMIIEKS